MGRRVRILTDSAVDLPQAYVTRFQIGVVPIHVSLNSETRLVDGTLDLDWFYAELSYLQVPPTTAAPAPQEFTRVYAQLASEGAEEIIAILTASTLSSLHDHALIAAGEFKEARSMWLVEHRFRRGWAGWWYGQRNYSPTARLSRRSSIR